MSSIIIGAGNYGEVYLAYLKEANINVIGFLDDNTELHGHIIQGIPVLGGVDLLCTLKATDGVQNVYCPIGNNSTRVRILSFAKELGYNIPNFIHNSVKLISQVDVASEGVYILPKVEIMPYTKIDKYVMISMGVNIAHHSQLSQGVFISTGVNLGANIIVSENSYIGIGATIMTGVNKLGNNCLIGAGSVVISDVPSNAVMIGVPAKILKYNN